MKEVKAPGINLQKTLDKVFVVGTVVWILFAWVLPSLFNTDSDVTMWMVFLAIGLVIYAAVRVVVLFIQKALDRVD